jgi:hypothetical protein
MTTRLIVGVASGPEGEESKNGLVIELRDQSGSVLV